MGRLGLAGGNGSAAINDPHKVLKRGAVGLSHGGGRHLVGAAGRCPWRLASRTPSLVCVCPRQVGRGAEPQRELPGRTGREKLDASSIIARIIIIPISSVSRLSVALTPTQMMTSSSSPSSSSISEDINSFTEPPNHKPASRTRTKDWDWAFLGSIIAIATLLVTLTGLGEAGFLHLEGKIDTRFDRLDDKIDTRFGQLQDLILSLNHPRQAPAIK